MCSFIPCRRCVLWLTILVYNLMLISLVSSCQSIEPISGENASHSASYLTKSSGKELDIPLKISGKDIEYTKTISVNSEGWPIVSYSFDSYETGLLYLSIIAMPADDAAFSVFVNGKNAGTMSSEGYGWQIMGLDGDGSVSQPVHIRRGANIIEFVSSAYEVPQIRDIVLSRREDDCALSLDNYQRYLQNIAANLYNNDNVQHVSSLNATGYMYNLACPVLYSTTMDMVIANNRSFTISVSGFSEPVVVDVYKDEVFTISYYLTPTSNEASDRLPNGHYTVHLRKPYQEDSQIGTITLEFNEYVESYGNSVASGYYIKPEDDDIRSIYPSGDVNYFTCNETNGCNPALYLCEGDTEPYLVRYANEDYTGPGDFNWGVNARSTFPFNNRVDVIHLSSSNPRNPEGECDVYQRMQFIPITTPPTPPETMPIYNWSRFNSQFQILKYNDAIVTGKISFDYNCFSWAGDITMYSEVPTCASSSYYIEGDPLGSFDNFYEMCGYTRDGANASNAAVALWANENGITHASIRNNRMSIHLHGYDWESKVGNWERIMHPRDALMSTAYGRIVYYYRPNPNRITTNPSTDNIEPLISLDYDTTIISSYINSNISEDVIESYSRLYDNWLERCHRPDISVHSNPFFYKQNEEYKKLHSYCTRFKDTVLPVIYEKVCEGDLLTMYLMEDLMNDEDKTFMEEIKKKNAEPGRLRAPIYNAMCYSVGAFERDYLKK